MSYFYIYCRQIETAKGNPAANQFIINISGTAYFQSYQTIIAKADYKDDRILITLDKNWNYSRTTVKYLNKFLKETLNPIGEFNTKTIKEYVKNGTFEIEDLNELPF